MIDKLFHIGGLRFEVRNQARMYKVFNDLYRRDNRYKRKAVLELEYIVMYSSYLGLYWDIRDDKKRHDAIVRKLDYGETFKEDANGLKKFKEHLWEDKMVKKAVDFIKNYERGLLSYRLLNSVEKAVSLQLDKIENINKSSEALLKTDEDYDISDNTEKILKYIDLLPEYLDKINKYHKKLKRDVSMAESGGKIKGGGKAGPMEDPEESLVNKV